MRKVRLLESQRHGAWHGDDDCLESEDDRRDAQRAIIEENAEARSVARAKEGRGLARGSVAAQKKRKTEEPEAASAEAAAAAASTRGAPAATASTPGAPSRRQAMKSRIIVHKKDGSEKYSLVRSATETVAEINGVIAARNRAIMDEARELYGAETPPDARSSLVLHGRACLAQGGQDHHWYLVLDFELQKRSRYYAFQDWASTPEGDWFLWKQDKRSGWWSRIPRESEAGRFVIPRDARAVLKNHCDHTFGGQTWFDVLNQMVGCPAEFVDAWNAVTNQRLQVAFKNILLHLGLWGGGCGFSIRLVPPRSNSYPSMAADASTLGEKTIQVENM